MVVLSGLIGVGWMVAPHGEYSNSNVGKVEAYKLGVGQTIFLCGDICDGDVGGVFGSGRFRDGVVFGVTPLLGVKLRTSRNANSNFAGWLGVLDALDRKLYGCGVATCWFSLSRLWIRFDSSDEPSDFRRASKRSRFLDGRWIVPNDRRLPSAVFPFDWFRTSAIESGTQGSMRLFTVHFNMLAGEI